jgi:EKC/KEOPS complex subunit CGI121/TPRKB
MEVYHFPHLQASVYAALFRDVKNAASLRTRLIKASTMPGDEGVKEREAVNFAFIDARLVRHIRATLWTSLYIIIQITSSTLLETAIHQALLTEEQGTLKTKYVHSEILWVLNPGSNVRMDMEYPYILMMEILSRSQRPSESLA